MLVILLQLVVNASHSWAGLGYLLGLATTRLGYSTCMLRYFNVAWIRDWAGNSHCVEALVTARTIVTAAATYQCQIYYQC